MSGGLASVGTAVFSLVIVLGNTRASVMGMKLPAISKICSCACSLPWPLPSKSSVCLHTQASAVCDQIMFSGHNSGRGERQSPVSLPQGFSWQLKLDTPDLSDGESLQLNFTCWLEIRGISHSVDPERCPQTSFPLPSSLSLFFFCRPMLVSFLEL